jgi:hypothetical protein
MKLKASMTTEVSASFVVGERAFHVVAEVMTVRSAMGKIFATSVSPIALLILEPHDRYAVSLTDEELNVEELLMRVPALKGKILAEDCL